MASFTWEDYAEALFVDRLMVTQPDRLKSIQYTALGSGLSIFFVFAVYSLGFWYGSQLVADGPANGGILLGDMLIVFFSIVISAAGFGQVMGTLPEFARARVAGYNLLKVIDRQPLIDRDDPAGIRDVVLQGDIEFDKVSFSFPSRPDQSVLNSLDIHIPPGMVVGVVGASGAGKSTLISLLQRFHDVKEGQIRIDGRPIGDYNLRWLRQSIGLVSQEPKLFDQSIAENIRVGKPEATMEEVIAAATAANAHRFIQELSDGYKTRVGEGGSQLSGGQKQRIAIARAVLKDPKIILLDEATSALDNESEAVVQEALDKLMAGRTTIVVAHRLSTIRNSSQICVMDKGKLVESGTHRSLLHANGAYYQLVVRQMNPEELSELHVSLKESKSNILNDL